MKSFSKNITATITLLLVISVIFSFFVGGSPAPVQFSVNELVGKINLGLVKSIEVADNLLSIEMVDGTKATATKEIEAGLSETLKNYGVNQDQFQKVAVTVNENSSDKFWLNILIPTVLPLLILVGFFWFMMRGAKGGQGQIMNFGKANLKLSAPGGTEKVTFNDVAGLKEAKQELVEIVDFLKNPKKFLDMGAKIPRGVLLMGNPGSGKTLLARAVSGESGVPFFYISASEFVEMFVGVGASRIRDAFTTAKKHSPSILFIDEIDAVGRQRGAGLGGGHDEREQTLNQILVEMDGFDRENQVIVLAATNRPDVLDSALLRPGRFDRQVVLDLPDINDREAILNIHAKNKPLAEGVSLRPVAIRTPGFSGADLENVLNEAAILAARADKKKVEQDDLFSAIEKVILGPERKSRVISEKEKEVTAYHEAGHALVAAALKDADPVHKISIISRGRAGGYTMKLPVEENRLKTKKQFLAEMATMMGGYASEHFMFKDVSTGASSDLQEATKLARRMVTKYGMSDVVGPVVYATDDESVFLGREFHQERKYSEAMSAKIDSEVSAFLHSAHDLAKKVLIKEKRVLDAIAKRLIEKETIEREEFEALMKEMELQPASL
jgi:cell division protease FtsH